jgi:hypothetical protein
MGHTATMIVEDAIRPPQTAAGGAARGHAHALGRRGGLASETVALGEAGTKVLGKGWHHKRQKM